MTTPRRRVLRTAPATVIDARTQLQLERRRARLRKERASLDRWMARLKRAFHAVEKQQRLVARLERQLAVPGRG